MRFRLVLDVEVDSAEDMKSLVTQMKLGHPGELHSYPYNVVSSKIALADLVRNNALTLALKERKDL